MRNIKTARSDIRCDHDPGLLRTESTHGAITLALTQATMDDDVVMIIGLKPLGKAFGAVLCLDENNDRPITGNQFSDQISIFVTICRTLHFMFYFWRIDLFRADANAFRVGQILTRKFDDAVRERRRKHQHLTLLRNVLEDFVDLFAKAHIKHTVGFVDGDEVDFF